MKVCTKCGESKPLEQFQDRPKSKHGKRATCRACTGVIQKDWVSRNPARRKAIYIKWKNGHREQLQTSVRLRRKRNPEKFRIAERRRYAKNAELRAAEAQRRRDRDRVAYNEMVRRRRLSDPTRHRAANGKRRANECGTVTASDIKAQYAAQGGKCYYCHREVAMAYEVDHFVALAAGGLHNSQNIVIACRTCNRRKNKFDAFAFFKKLGVQVEPLRRSA